MTMNFLAGEINLVAKFDVLKTHCWEDTCIYLAGRSDSVEDVSFIG